VRGGVHRRRLGLGPKVVALLLAIALAPLIASAILIDQLAEVAQNVASHQIARVLGPLEDAQLAYRELIDAKKHHYRALAEQVARGADDPLARVDAASLFTAEPDLLAIEILTGERPTRLERDPPPTPAPARTVAVEGVARDGGRARLTFAVDEGLVARLQAAGAAVADARRVETMRGELPRNYRTAFLLILGGVVIVAAATGVVLGRRFTRRIDRLVAGTRAVAAGELDHRVALRGRDELAELGQAFDGMVAQLGQDREQILYLQRMAAWQDVARRLAHEIKNPLTPIQLAVQQLHAGYQGDDARHRKQLADAAEIVGEEIAGLRRLVDAFRELGQLPRVEPAPLDLATVADDLARDPGLAARLALAPPAAPVTIQGDRLLLRRLLANLVENGLHAGEGAGRAGRVRLAWSAAPDGGARIEVDDEGPGVPPADRERIFEPYVTGKPTGTGLGLAIARKIALEHDGELAVDAVPAPVLGGARFIVTLPPHRRGEPSG
jgi:nitrogen fixation/metabolism regulation signal transduction histidine kinase